MAKGETQLKPKLFFNWSSGKDSAFALYCLQQQNEFKVDLLFSTVSSEHKRVSMHGLRESMLLKQAEAIELPLEIMYLPKSSEMHTYNALMKQKMEELKAKGYQNTAFGDIFLEDLKQYRIEQLKPLSIKALFPLWKKNTSELIRQFIDLGFKSRVVSANEKWFSEDFVGKDITHDLIDALPKEVDPCGENGEFHTFCYDGPIFKEPVQFETGEKVKRSYQNPEDKGSEVSFWFCDLIPK